MLLLMRQMKSSLFFLPLPPGIHVPSSTASQCSPLFYVLQQNVSHNASTSTYCLTGRRPAPNSDWPKFLVLVIWTNTTVNSWFLSPDQKIPMLKLCCGLVASQNYQSNPNQSLTTWFFKLLSRCLNIVANMLT